MNVKAFDSIENLNEYLLGNIPDTGRIPEGIEPPVQDGFSPSPVTNYMWTVEPTVLDKIEEFENVKVYTIDQSHYTGEGGCYENIRAYLLIDAR